MKSLGEGVPFRKFWGCVLIVAGSALGGGMLAIPMVSAHAGFAVTSLILVAFWAVMTLSALCVLEVCLACETQKSSFSSMAKMTLGKFGRIVTIICFLCLLYSTVSAYLAGGSTLVAGLLLLIGVKLPMWLNILLFALTFASVVLCGIKYVDYFMRFFLISKGVFFVILVSLLLPKSSLHLLSHLPTHWQSITLVIPIIMTAFGCHFVIPSIRIYVGNKPKSLRLIIIIGTSIPLLIYLIWVLAILGLIPLIGHSSFATLEQNKGSVDEFISIVTMIANSSVVTWVGNVFVNFAITTSFLGVSIGLFDFLAELFKRNNTPSGRIQTGMLTFVVPFIFAAFYPNGFVLALVYSAIFGALLELVLPVLMVLSLRRQPKRSAIIYQAPLNKQLLCGLLIVGVIVIILAFYRVV